MNKIDCFWEKRNLNSEVAEITIKATDHFSDFVSLSYSEKDYVVVKVPVNMPEFIIGLSNMGFTLIELQIDMTVKLNEFNYNEKLLKWIRSDTHFAQLMTNQELDELVRKITPGMFSTDRISIDPVYGPEIGCKRYINWISDEYIRNSSKILWMIYKGKKVGFMLYKDGTNMRGLLGGLFKEYQNMGIGLLTPCCLPLFVLQEKLQVKKVMADISSNNSPVWNLYQHFGYKATNPHYVFIKHN